MAIRTYRDPRIRIVDPVHVKLDYARQEALRRVDQIKHRIDVAVQTDPHEFHFYRKKGVSRGCSCWTLEDSPDGYCGICYGTGKVGGYDKFGCETHILDVTYPDVRSVNVLPNYSLQTRPVFFTLTKNSTFGFVEFTVHPTIRAGVDNPLDAFQLAIQVKKGNTVLPYLKGDGDTTFTALDMVSLTNRINSNVLIFRFELKRGSLKVQTPVLSHFLFRKKLRSDVTVIADVPKASESTVLLEYGVQEQFTSRSMYLPADRLREIGTEDFFVELKNGFRWKPTSTQASDPYGVRVSWDIETRKIQEFEVYYQII